MLIAIALLNLSVSLNPLTVLGYGRPSAARGEWDLTPRFAPAALSLMDVKKQEKDKIPFF